jgi:hypothetical protein
MSKAVSLDFSKFFPTDQSFVAVKARASQGDDFYVNLAFGDGENKVTYYASEHNAKEILKQMQFMLEGLEKSMEFLQKAITLPVSPEEVNPVFKWFDNAQAAIAKAPVMKATKKKKSAVK